MPETKTVLITVKAPPNSSRRYQETNCCAGIEVNTCRWIRLYPIPFRLLDDSRKFPKYSIIKVKCEKPIRDKRIESFKVDQDSIEVGQFIDTKDNWAKRKEIVLPTISPSFCKILEDVSQNKSLGVFKPCEIQFLCKKMTVKNPTEHLAAYNQLRLFDKNLKPLEQIPFAFYYVFKCSGQQNCSGHTLQIHDWEITESYRSWRDKYPSQKLLMEKIREKWLDVMCGIKKDVYFYVGNMWQRPKQFMVLGVFYPPKL